MCFTVLKYRKKEKTGKMILQIDDDFDLRKIMDSGQCFRWEQLDRHTYRIPYLDQRLYVTDLGGGAFELSCGDEQLALWRDYFDLAEDYRAIRAIPDPVKDPFLTRAAEAEKGIRILRQDPWEVTVSFIISQNRNIPAIRRSVELLCAAAGQKRIDGRGEAFHAFPTPEEILALSDADLSECRLGYRCRYVRAAARAVSGGELDFAALKLMDPESARAELMTVQGIGVKVASCIQLFGLHQMDSFPVDVWIRRILQNEYPDGYPMEAYRPWNGVFQQYMFAYYRQKSAASAIRKTV